MSVSVKITEDVKDEPVAKSEDDIYEFAEKHRIEFIIISMILSITLNSIYVRIVRTFLTVHLDRTHYEHHNALLADILLSVFMILLGACSAIFTVGALVTLTGYTAKEYDDITNVFMTIAIIIYIVVPYFILEFSFDV